MSASIDVLPVTSPAEGIAGPTQGSWTYAQYTALPDDGRRFEVADGVLYMTPAPNFRHQEVSLTIAYHLREYVKAQAAGKVAIAPLDVELSSKNVVQPDVLFVSAANLSIIGPSRIIGVPDLVVEVTSPSSETYDRGTKLEIYAAAGVQEYWIVDPEAQTVELLCREARGGAATASGLSSQGVFLGGAVLPSRVLPDFDPAVAKFFE